MQPNQSTVLTSIERSNDLGGVELRSSNVKARRQRKVRDGALRAEGRA